MKRNQEPEKWSERWPPVLGEGGGDTARSHLHRERGLTSCSGGGLAGVFRVTQTDCNFKSKPGTEQK